MPVSDPLKIGFVGLGRMGLPMAGNLIAAGHSVTGWDTLATARKALADAGGRAADTPADAYACGVIITMLPDGKSVTAALDQNPVAPGSLVIDMSSSAPEGTQELGARLAGFGVALVDAPVSGGVVRARAATLSIMAGGADADVDRAMPVLAALGTVHRTGGLGTGHAAKALNNYVSAAGLVAACRAMLVAERFGLDPKVLNDILNVSTGRNNSTEVKMQQFILSQTFGSGFALNLMAKDLRTAADLAKAMGVDGVSSDADLWSKAEISLGADADHTEIIRALAGRSRDETKPEYE